jgi:dipeptidyl aminopeptidase/acylaminoacyl peptidase
VEVASGYDKPPQYILDVLHAPSPPTPVVSPTKDRLLLVSWQDYPPMSRVATPFLKLAGVRVEPKNHSKHDTPGGYGITPCATAYVLVRVPDGAEAHVALPQGTCPGRPSWTADGKQFSFQNIASDSVELWVGDAASGQVRRVPGVNLNPMLGHTVQWMADQKTLLVKMVPAGLGAPPPAPAVPMGPSIQETHGEKGQSSTYENRDTLTSKHDEEEVSRPRLKLVEAAG